MDNGFKNERVLLEGKRFEQDTIDWMRCYILAELSDETREIQRVGDGDGLLDGCRGR